MFSTDDTIVAISTAAGSGARAIVRLSGPAAMGLAGRVFSMPAGRLEDLGGFRSADGLVRIPAAARGGAAIELPARAYVFRAPRSYTRQDVVEFHLPGAPVAANALCSALVEAGARAAQPGEFTARAFLSGRLDLSEAEAVADVIDAAGDAQLRSAASALGGRVHRMCSELAGEIADALATVEASIDLAGEDIAVESPDALRGRLAGLAGRLRSTADQAADIVESADVPRVVLAGRPNVGKSSLLNALSGADRAIISSLAGTTRDVLSAAMSLAGSPVMLQDAAGFVPHAVVLAVGAAADAAARAAVARADAILLVVDITQIGTDPIFAGIKMGSVPIFVLANKADLLPAAEADRRSADLAGRMGLTVVTTSALTGQGLHRVRELLAGMLNLSASRGGEALGLHHRQKRCLLAAANSLAAAGELLSAAGDVSDVAELLAVELRGALGQIGQISGQVVTEDVLGRIFARFCVGK